jgi:hypothetical protein
LQALEKRVLKRISGPKRYEGIGDRRKVHNLYSSPNIIRMNKSNRLRWKGHEACMGEMRNS